MKTMTVDAQIAPDGTLRLELPTGLPPGPADVVVVVQPKASSPFAQRRSLDGMFATGRPAEFNAVAEVRDIRRQATQESGEFPE